MPLSVNEELRRTFELATLRKEAKTIETPHQWRDVAKLQLRCQDARTREKDLYAARYETRVEVRRRQLIDEAGARPWSLQPAWAGNDRFNPEDNLRQAQRDVRLQHAARIEKIDGFERRELAMLLRRFRFENDVRDLARDDFNRAADRRTGPQTRRHREREH